MRKQHIEVLNSSRPHQNDHQGWKFPYCVDRQLQRDFAGARVLQLFAGSSQFGLRADLDIDVHPDVVADAWLPPFPTNSFDAVILDPPYDPMNEQTKLNLLRSAGAVSRHWVVWFHTHWTSQTLGLKLRRSWLVRCGDNCAVRCLLYFEKTTPIEFPSSFERGIQRKYDRWLRQPAGLPFPE